MKFNRIKTTLAAGFLALAAVSAVPAQAATLLGDVVTIGYLFPTISTAYSGFSTLPATVTVADGSSDRVTVRSGPTRYFTVNIDANSITLTFLDSYSFTNASFNGIVISGIDEALAGISQTGAPLGSVTAGSHSIYFNLAGQSFRHRDTIVATPVFEPAPSVVPLPGAMPLAAGAFALVGMFGRRRRRGAGRA